MTMEMFWYAGVFGRTLALLQRGQDVGVERVVGEHRGIVVQALERRRQAALDGRVQLVLRVPQAERGLEGQVGVRRVLADRQVDAADGDAGGLVRR